MTQNDNGPDPSRNYGETAIYTFSQKAVLWQKVRFFSPKKHPKFAKQLIFFWKQGTVLFAQLFPVVARTWLELRSELFFGPKNPFFAIEHQTLSIALGNTFHFQPS